MGALGIVEGRGGARGGVVSREGDPPVQAPPLPVSQSCPDSKVLLLFSLSKDSEKVFVAASLSENLKK